MNKGLKQLTKTNSVQVRVAAGGKEMTAENKKPARKYVVAGEKKGKK